ncbi:hypothetical protein [Ruminococcus sp.]|uniref:hypothetical protein n=1 Tax=Ruminococcus sp. TaxID=41978 RepID=UPI0025EAAF14|nr:hypothetical protein [Ruminococcus sp.]MBQ8965091.1 hypothetical protein [Ruminococcus sp.]
MKKLIPFVLAAGLMFSACGQTETSAEEKTEPESKLSQAEQTVTADVPKPDMDEISRILSGYLSHEYERYLDDPEGSDMAAIFEHPDELYLAEPQLIYEFSGMGESMTAKAEDYDFFLIDKADNELLMWYTDISEGGNSGGGAQPAQTELFAAGKGFITGYDENGSPVYIADGKVYSALSEDFDVSAVSLPDPEPLAPVYKLDIKTE